MSWYHRVSTLSIASALTMSCFAQRPLEVSATNLPPSTTTNVRSAQIVDLNLFRYESVVVVQDKTSNPQPPPPPFNGAGGGGGTPAQAPAVVPTPPAPAPPAPPPGVPPPPDPLKPLEDAIAGEEQTLNNLTGQTQDLLNNAALATACFKDLEGRYPEVLLTTLQRNALVSDLKNSPNCKLTMLPWPSDQITAEINQGPAISNLFIQLSATIATNDPKGTLLARHTAAQTGLQSLFTSSSASTLATANIYVGTWQQRLDKTLAASDDQWSPTVALTCHPQWFGKTEQQVVSIYYYDMSASAPTQQSMSLFTNSCLASLTISSGIGISTVRSSTFAFTPQTNYSVTPPTTTQVIGYAADSRVLPIYVGAMNYEFARTKSMGLDFAGGAGVGSSSGGTTSDFFVGPSFAFARRAIFVSPSFHLTQRQTLQDGYHVGDAQGALTSVPTINRWRYGFAITFTFPVLQSQ
jgi:hypothetical protein